MFYRFLCNGIILKKKNSEFRDCSTNINILYIKLLVFPSNCSIVLFDIVNPFPLFLFRQGKEKPISRLLSTKAEMIRIEPFVSLQFSTTMFYNFPHDAINVLDRLHYYFILSAELFTLWHQNTFDTFVTSEKLYRNQQVRIANTSTPIDVKEKVLLVDWLE